MKISEIQHSHGIIEIEIACSKQKVSLLNIGASFVRWLTTSGKDILARYDDIQEYNVNAMYLGVTVGPNAGRIENGQFKLGAKEYQMKEEKSHFLHSGEFGFSRSLFDYAIEKNDDEESIVVFTLDYSHPLLPGKQHIKVSYIVKQDDVVILFDVESDQETLCNLTNHVYINLDGTFDREIETHSIQVPANKVLLMDQNLIGTKFVSVENTPFDFQQERAILPSVLEVKATDKAAFGLDHYYLFTDKAKTEIVLKSSHHPYALTISSSYPGATVYSTNFPSTKAVQTGAPLPLHSAVCVEPEFIGNAINRSDVEIGLVSKEKPYHHQIHYHWGVL
ncbi:MAG: hypothetical protein AB7U79_00500 [Candidatus Izemoplasmatales bacterium]